MSDMNSIWDMDRDDVLNELLMVAADLISGEYTVAQACDHFKNRTAGQEIVVLIHERDGAVVVCEEKGQQIAVLTKQRDTLREAFESLWDQEYGFKGEEYKRTHYPVLAEIDAETQENRDGNGAG